MKTGPCCEHGELPSPVLPLDYETYRSALPDFEDPVIVTVKETAIVASELPQPACTRLLVMQRRRESLGTCHRPWM